MKKLLMRFNFREFFTDLGWDVTQRLVGLGIIISGLLILSAFTADDYNFTIFLIGLALLGVTLAVAKMLPDHRTIRSAEDAGVYGESLLIDVIRPMIGAGVNGYITSNNIVHNGTNFEIDCLALVPESGLVLMEVKYYSGQVKCTSGTWTRTNRMGETVEMGNASRQVLRTERLLKTLLKSDNLDRWPITSLVVHAHPDVALRYGDGEHAPQTDIVPLAHLHSYLSELPKDPNVRFTRDDFEAIRTAIKQNEKAYQAAPMYKRSSA